ncbi:MAG: GNAT family N-acetyltransferase [Muribaculaceae bacterium]|nr:GNAT family N-acetyltransferase [Muribaculaceae bacterium]
MNEAFRIEEITDGKERFMELLLVGDESADMIARYLHDGRLFAAFSGGTSIAVCVVCELGSATVEVKNLAVRSEYRRRGLGRAILGHVEKLYPGHRLTLGTGETPSTLRFYRNCGFRYSHTVKDFFTDNYPEPIIEEGVLLKDMIYLTKESGRE